MSGWKQELQRQLSRGKHIILHGNVRDLVAHDGGFHNFSGALDFLLEAEGYTLRTTYQPGDVIRYSSEEMEARFIALQPRPESIRGRPASPLIPGGAAPSAGGAMYGTPDVAMTAIRVALSGSNEELVSAAVYFSDRLFQSGDGQGREDRHLMVALVHAAETAYRWSDEPHEGKRNALVLVASALGQVPAWIYRDNPLFAVIQVEKPTVEGRREFLRQFYDMFHGPLPNSAPTSELEESFVALTDGFSYWDLEALRLASNHEKIAISECRKLVDFFKHGVTEDPWSRLANKSRHDITDFLTQRVIGQKPAVDAVADVLISAIGGIHADGPGQRSVRPKGVLFFVGPTGVGKTELAKQVTELVFGDSASFIRFDMSEYQQEHAAERLTGAPPSYVGYEAGGQLTNQVKRRPFSVILFDEIEKAHPKIFDKFLQVLDDGRLTDGQGETVYFSQALLIFTSNIGSTMDGARVLGPDTPEAEVAAHFKAAVRKHFMQVMKRPELLGRIGEENIVAFDVLRIEHVDGILDKFLRGIEEQLQERYGLALEVDPSIRQAARDFCAEPDNNRLGGRAIRNFVEKRLVVHINECVTSAPPSARRLRLSVRDGKVAVSLT